MTSQEERERRRKRLKRSKEARELREPKYRQRVLPKKRKGGRNDKQTDEDLLVDNGGPVDKLDDPVDWS